MKKILFSLLCLIGFSSFCSSNYYYIYGDNDTGTYTGDILNLSNFPDGQLFVVYYNCSNPYCTLRLKKGNGSSSCDIILNIDKKDFYNRCNNRSSWGTVKLLTGSSGAPLFEMIVFSDELPITCPTCPSQYTSEECQSVYGLVSSGVLNQCNSDLGTCQSSLSGCQTSLSGRNNTLNNCSNNLLSCESSLASCIQSNCPIDTGDVMWSSIWINGIQHLGKPVINIDIPDQIYRQYTTDDEEFNLYVGSGYDQEYIDNVIAINSYHPTSEDFTSVFVGGLTLIMPYIFIALLILFIRKLVKRIFK